MVPLKNVQFEKKNYCEFSYHHAKYVRFVKFLRIVYFGHYYIPTSISSIYVSTSISSIYVKLEKITNFHHWTPPQVV